MNTANLSHQLGFMSWCHVAVCCDSHLTCCHGIQAAAAADDADDDARMPTLSECDTVVNDVSHMT